MSSPGAWEGAWIVSVEQFGNIVEKQNISTLLTSYFRDSGHHKGIYLSLYISITMVSLSASVDLNTLSYF